MNYNKFLVDKFSYLGNDFLKELDECSLVTNVDARTEIMIPGQRINYIPIVIEGLVKVYSLNNGRELLYYYIKPGESCIMTVGSVFQNPISRIYVYADEPTKVVLIPIANFFEFIKKYPLINNVFYKEFDTRYLELVNLMNDAIFHKLDFRVLNYIQKQAEISGTNLITMSHKEIASGLGTVREVVSRVLKKLVNDGQIIQHKNGIELLNKKIEV